VIFRLPFGYAFNGGWFGFGQKRSKDDEVWFVQIWHPLRRNLLASNNTFFVTEPLESLPADPQDPLPPLSMGEL